MRRTRTRFALLLARVVARNLPAARLAAVIQVTVVILIER